MKQILDDAQVLAEGGNMELLIESFYKNTENYKFNKSINFLI